MKRLLLVFVCACGGSSPPPPTEPLITEEMVPPPARPPGPPRPAAPVLTRTALNAALDAGPGAFLARVDVRAARAAGRFAGWEIVSLWANARIELRPGDVVLAVNGRTLERPESLSALFTELRSAREIVVDYRRGLERREARFPVVEEAGTIRP
jgi:hypothetical protein